MKRLQFAGGLYSVCGLCYVVLVNHPYEWGRAPLTELQ